MISCDIIKKSIRYNFNIKWSDIMKLKKCPVCKMMIPEKSESCPICGTEYTKFQYFRMNNLSKCILIILAVLIVYNSTVIILFNRTIRGYADEPPKDISVVEELKDRYNRLNFIQQYFVRYSEIEIVEDSIVDESRIINVENHKCSVRFMDGRRVGTYTGEMYKEEPQGNGSFSYYDNAGKQIIYNGEFAGGEITGFGTMHFEDGSRYVGDFEQGVLDGYGIWYNSEDKIVRKGDFISGRLNGMATIYDDFGDEIYSGRFVSDIPTERDYKDACKETTFAQLEADTDVYINKNIKISGVITEIAIQDDMTVYYVMNIAGNSYKNVCIEYIGRDGVNIRQGDKLNFYGYCAGYREYMSSSGILNGGMVIKTYYAN